MTTIKIIWEILKDKNYLDKYELLDKAIKETDKSISVKYLIEAGTAEENSSYKIPYFLIRIYDDIAEIYYESLKYFPKLFWNISNLLLGKVLLYVFFWAMMG